MGWLIGNKLWTRFATWVKSVSGLEPATLGNIFNTLLVIIAYLALTRALRRLVVRRTGDLQRRFTLNKSISYGFGVLATIALAKIWILGNVKLATYLGIVSAGLAIALKDPIVNIAGWIFIMWRQPLKIGDRVQIGDQAGDVTDVGLFMMQIAEIGKWVEADQSTGRIVHIPNGRVFSSTIANFTQGIEELWNEVAVTVTFESNWLKAHRILTKVVNRLGQPSEETIKRAREHAEKNNVAMGYLTPIVWVEVVDIGVKLTLRFLCGARQRRTSADRMWREVLRVFAGQPDIDFAYPTQRFYANHLEGKAQAGGPPADESKRPVRKKPKRRLSTGPFDPLDPDNEAIIMPTVPVGGGANVRAGDEGAHAAHDEHDEHGHDEHGHEEHGHEEHEEATKRDLSA